MNRNFVKIAVYYALIFMGAGAYSSYIGLYYSDIGYGTAQIGTLSTLAAVMAILVQPYWGLLADRAKYKNNVLLLCTFVTTISIWLVPFAGDRYGLLIVATLFITIFQCPIFPMSTTVTLEIAGRSGFKFSSVRTMGSVGFALMSVLAGWMIKLDLIYIFVLYSSLMLLTVILNVTVPKVKGHQHGGKKLNLKEVFKNKRLIYIFIYAMFIQATISFYFSFQAIYSTEVGISTGMIGLGLMIGSLSQFPFMIWFDKLYKKFGITNILLFAGLVQAVRMVLFAYFNSPASILFLWILHGGTIIMISLSLMEYVNATVLPELRASGQMMNAIVMQGLATIVGSFAGGTLASHLGLQMTFVIYSGVSLAAALCFWYVVRRSVLFREPAMKRQRQETVSL
ncbi:MFS transporter [Paenibacillus koleovorans]|uniref:MFS transporter n=1 Tax=Paenibacillus koleovorans TaxID=121608 RepID=UPI0013E2B887|nr:MFS transporter [Paenibacillus koleovorans]